MARKRGNRYISDVRAADGQRFRLSFPTLEAATEWEQEARKAVVEGRPIPNPQSGPTPLREGPKHLQTLGGLFDFVAKTDWKGMKSEKTALLNAKTVLDYFGRNIDPNTIGPIEIATFRAELHSRGLSPATANRKVAALSKMLRVGETAGVVTRAPKMKNTRESKTRFRYLDETEEKTLLAYWKAANDPHQHDLCMALIDTGARCYSEMIPLKWKDCAADMRQITFWDTKTGNPRTVPLTKRTRAMLLARKEAYPKSEGPFRGQFGGQPITKSTMRSRWDTMREVTGFHDVTPHVLRHTCCTRLVLGGVDVKRVMTWMGHSAIQTTMRYMQIRERSLEEVLHVLEAAA